ncbi:MAG: hypothetical protein HFE62_00225 [Firmicutes bacterium]|nr:hypothetical protein [Bacillota bacterium]
MFNGEVIQQLVHFISSRDGLMNKDELSAQVVKEFNLGKDGSTFYGQWFAIRFCMSKSKSLGNTVVALSILLKHDNVPFIVCAVTPEKNYMRLANSTFVKKISHSSQGLREDKIVGSVNGSDIIWQFESIDNIPQNFEALFNRHMSFSYEENVKRIVEETSRIAPKGKRFVPTPSQKQCILQSVERAMKFLLSDEYAILGNELDSRVKAAEAEIVEACHNVGNVNLRGRFIEYFITSDNTQKKSELFASISKKKAFPEIFTADGLGDYRRKFDKYVTEIDIKTKILSLSSQPKGYNIDKVLSFLSEKKSVYLIYVVAIDDNKGIKSRLCSMYNTQLLSNTRIMKQWAGRNSRGVAQFGHCFEDIVDNFDSKIDEEAAKKFLNECLNR